MGYIWLCAVLALLILLLLFPLRLRIEYGFCKNAKKQRLTVWLNGLRLLKNDFEKKKDKTKKDAKPSKENKDAYGGFMDKLRFYDALYTHLKADIENVLKFLQRKHAIPKFTLHLDLGFNDAAQTGIAAGAAYALVYGVAGLIYNNLNLKKKDLDVAVTPHFHSPKIDFYFNGIFRLRAVHIISVLFLIFGIYRKYKNFKNKTKEGGVLV